MTILSIGTPVRLKQGYFTIIGFTHVMGILHAQLSFCDILVPVDHIVETSYGLVIE